MSLTAEDQSGAALFWTDPGGEIRYYVRGSEEIGYTLASSERAQAEQFQLFGSSMLVMERHLFAVFSSAIRSKAGLSRLIFPSKQTELAEGYAMSELDPGGYRTLSGSRALLARARGNVSSISILVRLSHLLSNSLEDVKTSLEDPSGRPLLDVRG